MNNEKMIESIRTLCRSNNISPTKLEEELGFSQGLISRWKDKTPSLDKIVDIADYFHVSLDEVVGRNQNLNDNTTKQFVSTLIKMTKNGNAKWLSALSVFLLPEDYKIPPDIMYSIKNFNSYPDDERNVDVFVLKYSGSYITLKGNIITKCYAIQQYEFSLFIQINNKTKPVYQNCEQEQLLELYKSISESISGKLPETLSNDFKEQFIKDNN